MPKKKPCRQMLQGSTIFIKLMLVLNFLLQYLNQRGCVHNARKQLLFYAGEFPIGAAGEFY